ncbi:MAG: SsrA-binding protein SmpB [Candidatus Woykebacteria bacterium]
MVLVTNKKSRYEYLIYDKFEAGIILSGAEVKSVRSKAASLSDSYVRIEGGEAFLINAHISPYKAAFDPSYDPKRQRKLLLSRKEIDHLSGKITTSSLTIVPTKMYTKHNLVKLEVALARAKKKADKREALKKRDIEREAEAIVRAPKLKAQKQLKN